MRLLKVTSGPSAGQSVKVVQEIVIGREGADLTISDPEISRRHAAVRPTAGGVEVEDLGSVNGTFVNGSHIVEAVTMHTSGTLRVGNTSLEIELDVQEIAAPAPADETVMRPARRMPDPDVTAPRAKPRMPDPDVTAPRAKPRMPDPDVTAPRAKPRMPDPDVTAERAKPPASETDGKATRDSPAVSDHAATRMRTAPPPQPPRRPTTPPAATSAGDLPAVDPAELPLFRWAFRLAFVILVLGLTAIAHPQPEPDAVPPDEGSFLHTILTYDFWFPIHLASITAYMLGLVLFLAYYRSMPEQPAKSIASVAAAFGVVSTAVVAIWVVVDMVSIVRLAELWEADPTAANLAAINAVEEVILALFSLSVILYTGLTFALFGLAMLHSRLYPDWVGIWGLLGGIFSMLAGTAQLVTSRDALVTDVVIPLAFFVTTVWFLVATVIMWRRVSAAAAPTAST